MWITVEHAGKRHRVAVRRTPQGVWVGYPGGATFVVSAQARATQSTSTAGHAEVRAPMTGRVVQVGVAPGDAVEADSLLVVLEAMKMEYRLTAPRAGIVESVRCQAGEQVDLGTTLVTLSA